MAFNETGTNTMKAASTGDYVALEIWGDFNISNGGNWGSLDFLRSNGSINELCGRISTSYNDLALNAKNDRNIRLHVAGGKGLFVKHGGNVGVGNTSASRGHLDVEGDNGTGYGIATTGDIKIIKNSARLLVGEGTSGGQFGSVTWNHTDNTLCLGTEAGGETTQLQIDGDSNVGINTNPTKNLSVYFSDSNTSITAGHGLSGGADGSGVLIYNGNSTANSYANLDFRAHTADGRIAYQTSGADNTADFRFILDSTSGINERMCIIGETGCVGIGDVTPTHTLEVKAASGQFMVRDDNDAQIFLVSNDNVVMGYETAGNCGIGTSSPAQKLEVSENVNDDFVAGFRNPNAGGWGVQIQAGDSSGEYTFHCKDYDDANPLFWVRGDGTAYHLGNVGIGDASPSYKLEVAGTFYASGSSANFKKNVTDLAVDSSAIYNLNPVSYNYKKDYENFGYDLAEGKQFGLISEEVAQSIPELAIMKDGEPKNVDYQKLSVLLLAEMQKMNKRIKDLECHI